jgi:hypothetical protein
VKSVGTRRFWNLFHALPAHVQELAVKYYHLWQLDPHDPSLHFRKLEGTDDRFSVRVGDHYRALGKQAGDTMIRVWIGTHAGYDRTISSKQ